MFKEALIDFDIHPLLKGRWSPRAFSGQPVEKDKLLSLFEAARWSPSANNLQPWHFVVAEKSDAKPYRELVDALFEGNQSWAREAPVLALAVTKIDPERPAFSRIAYYDLGQAVAHLTIQAENLGLRTHQMGGFNVEKARELFKIPEGYEPVTVIAVGYMGEVKALPESLQERELARRSRKPLAEFVFEGLWRKPFSPKTSEGAEKVA